MNQNRTDTAAESLYRFGGIVRLYGQRAFENFQQAHVLVIGLGGVGSWAVEALARSGVGALTLLDYDDICVSNTNRQIHATQENIGKFKTQALRERGLTINPHCLIRTVEESFSEETEELIFSQKYSVVIDCIDSTKYKFILRQACHKRHLPIVVVGAAGGRWDPSLVRIGDLSQSCEDPILALLRKQLRQKARFPRKGSMQTPCVYSVEKAKYPVEGGAICKTKPESFKKPLDCTTGLGTATPVTGTFGFMAAHLALQKLS